MASDIEYSVRRLTRLNGEGSVKAFCDVAIANAFLLKGIKVVDGRNGLFVSMPREQGKNGQWYETIVPLTKTARAQLSDVVLEAYHAKESMIE